MKAEIHPATAVSADVLRDAMLDAFSDYAIPMRLGQQDFDAMMRQRGLDLRSSRIAVVGQQVAAIWLTSVRDRQGYLISSGTRPAHRSKGLARLLAGASLGHMRDTGVRSFQTEVLRNNETALGLYHSLGMAKKRRLDCYRLPAVAKVSVSISGVKSGEWAHLMGAAAWLREWSPTWQNSDAAIASIAERVSCLTYSVGVELAGYIALSCETGTVYQLAVRDTFRRRGVAQSLLGEALKVAVGNDLRLLNVDAADEGFRNLMNRVRAEETIGQHELYMDL